ncbi:hypothetical protein F5Y11DRAFT_346492 [Daldinia sp. FL1419]|nr:hypothetical protein F5Y11DRAFT_346492 [Daldinia sp. FL1419]
MAGPLDGDTDESDTIAHTLQDSDYASGIDLLKLAQAGNRVDRVQNSPILPFRTSSLPSLPYQNWLRDSSSKKHPSPQGTTSNKKPRKTQYWDNSQQRSTMDSFSSLPKSPASQTQEQEVCQLPSNSIQKPQPQPQEDIYTNLHFEVESSTLSTVTCDDPEKTEEEAPKSGLYTISEQEIDALPYNLGLIYRENLRMDAEARQREKDKATEKARIEAEKKANEMRWPGDTSAYPADSFVFTNPVGSALRAKAVHIGTPKSHPPTARVSVYAIRQDDRDNIEFRMARDGSSLEEIRQGPLFDYDQIRHNDYFKGMEQSQADIWVRQLTAQVPGINDCIVKWK